MGEIDSYGNEQDEHENEEQQRRNGAVESFREVDGSHTDLRIRPRRYGEIELLGEFLNLEKMDDRDTSLGQKK